MPLRYDIASEDATSSSAEEQAFERLLRGAETSLVGRGVTLPFRFDGKRDFQNATGIELLESQIVYVLGTYATSALGPGELPWRPEFGSWLELLRHSDNDLVTEELARQYVIGALRRWLPQVRVTAVDLERVATHSDDDTLWIVVRFVPVRRRLQATRYAQEGTARVPVPIAA